MVSNFNRTLLRDGSDACSIFVGCGILRESASCNSFKIFYILQTNWSEENVAILINEFFYIQTLL